MKITKQKKNRFRRSIITLHLDPMLVEKLNALYVSPDQNPSFDLLVEDWLRLLIQRTRRAKLERRVKRARCSFSLAATLFEGGIVSAGRAAKLASLSKPGFIERLGLAGIPAVNYPPGELEKELDILGAMPDVGFDSDFER